MKVTVKKLTETEISKWKEGISSVKSQYNFVYSTKKVLDVQKVQVFQHLEKKSKKEKSEIALAKHNIEKIQEKNRNRINKKPDNQMLFA